MRSLGEKGRPSLELTSQFLSSPEIVPAHLDSSQRDLRKEEGRTCCWRERSKAAGRDPAGWGFLPEAGTDKMGLAGVSLRSCLQWET